jgi:murein peptide amidase A
MRGARTLGAALLVLAGCSAPSNAATGSRPPPSGGASAGVPGSSSRSSPGASAVGTPTGQGPRYPAIPPAGVTCHAASAPENLVCVVGHSVQGRPITAERQGSAAAARVLLVLGQMHGEEWPGPLVVDRVRSATVPTGAAYQVWTVRTMNPDGGAVGQRYDAHGVNLNANFPTRWARSARSGSRPMSEPESVAVVRLLDWLQPDLVISIHGFEGAVDTTGGGLRAARARQLQAMVDVGPARVVGCGGPCQGNLTDWYTATSRRGGVAFTVEMPRVSLAVLPCHVPGHAREQVVVDCVALAALELAARL